MVGNWVVVVEKEFVVLVRSSVDSKCKNPALNNIQPASVARALVERPWRVTESRGALGYTNPIDLMQNYENQLEFL